MASANEIKALVMDRLEVSFKPLQPKVINGHRNPHYPAYVAEYLEALAPYPPQAIKAAMDVVMAMHEFTGAWPA